MTQEDQTVSTSPLKIAREKPFLFLGLGGAVVILTILFVIALRSYGNLLLATPTPAAHPVAQCGVVLTGAAGRIREAMSLLSHKAFKKLVISGVHQHATLGDMFPEALFYPEIELENVILERRSSSTAGNAQASLPLVEALNCKTVMLITSDYHMYRALRTFRDAFPKTVEIIPYAISSDRLHRHPHLLFNARLWSTVFEEWTKYIFYELFVFT